MNFQAALKEEIKIEMDIKEEMFDLEEISSCAKISPVNSQFNYCEDKPCIDGPPSLSSRKALKIHKQCLKRELQPSPPFIYSLKESPRNERIYYTTDPDVEYLSSEEDGNLIEAQGRKMKMSPEARCRRKKEQNKQAASRYRQKRKQRLKEIQKNIEAEEQRRNSLEMTVNSLTKEPSLWKLLMSPEARCRRKKEQNKQAASRYRQKRKQRLKEIQKNIEAEEQRRNSLEMTFNSLTKELSLLKLLMSPEARCRRKKEQNKQAASRYRQKRKQRLKEIQKNIEAEEQRRNSLEMTFNSLTKEPSLWKLLMSPEARCRRKKEQNKQAASRYRQKRKQRLKEIQKNIEAEEQRRNSLEMTFNSLTKELSLLKLLMSPEARCRRKKEQNKQAASRYRQKRKQRLKEIQKNIEAEEQRRNSLEMTFNSLTKELSLLKLLMSPEARCRRKKEQNKQAASRYRQKRKQRLKEIQKNIEAEEQRRNSLEMTFNSLTKELSLFKLLMSPEARCRRKKEQNKQAASRYRQKRKQRLKEIQKNIEAEEQRRNSLEMTFNSLTKELSLLKLLMSPEARCRRKKEQNKQAASRYRQKRKQRLKEIQKNIEAEEQRRNSLEMTFNSLTKEPSLWKLLMSPEARCRRKKEQNKQAASRYRQKRKQRLKEIQKNIEAEEQRRNSLEMTFNSLTKELSLLKLLMRECVLPKETVQTHTSD